VQIYKENRYSQIKTGILTKKYSFFQYYYVLLPQIFYFNAVLVSI